MKFRTEIESVKCNPISHDSRLLMMGSCFTTNIGEQLAIDGFEVKINPTGVLYNPASIAGMIHRAMNDISYSPDDLIKDENNLLHLLDFPNSMQGTDPQEVLLRGNSLLKDLSHSLANADTLIITFGTAWIFELKETGLAVGNCHKLPASLYNRRRMSVEEIVSLWKPIISGRRVIFTVSPIRHLADGLNGNCLSKSTLQLAVDGLVREGAEYFPAYEIMMDDLRDYRFYASDMKHPSETAVEYIYEIFKSRYFSSNTEKMAAENRKQYIHSQHRRIL